MWRPLGVSWRRYFDVIDSWAVRAFYRFVYISTLDGFSTGDGYISTADRFWTGDIEETLEKLKGLNSQHEFWARDHTSGTRMVLGSKFVLAI